MEKEWVIYAPNSERAYKKYAYFLSKLEALFVDTAEVQRSWAALARLKQGSRTALEFFSEFKKLQFLSNYTSAQDPVLIQFIRQNVNETIIDKILNSEDLPESYDEWRDRVIRLNQIWQDRQVEKKFWCSGGGYLAQGNAAPKKKESSSEPTLKDDDAMQVDRRKGITCFNCGRKGHIAKDCRAPRKARTLVEEIKEMSKEDRAALKQLFQ